MKPIIWEFISCLTVSTDEKPEGEHCMVAAAISIDRIQSIVQEKEGCPMIYCTDGSSWRPFGYSWLELVNCWKAGCSLPSAFDPEDGSVLMEDSEMKP
jgi:hypothetical protein